MQCTWIRKRSLWPWSWNFWQVLLYTVTNIVAFSQWNHGLSTGSISKIKTQTLVTADSVLWQRICLKMQRHLHPSLSRLLSVATLLSMIGLWMRNTIFRTSSPVSAFDIQCIRYLFTPFRHFSEAFRNQMRLHRQRFRKTVEAVVTELMQSSAQYSMEAQKCASCKVSCTNTLPACSLGKVMLSTKTLAI